MHRHIFSLEEHDMKRCYYIGAVALSCVAPHFNFSYIFGIISIICICFFDLQSGSLYNEETDSRHIEIGVLSFFSGAILL